MAERIAFHASAAFAHLDEAASDTVRKVFSRARFLLSCRFASQAAVINGKAQHILDKLLGDHFHVGKRHHGGGHRDL
jgi:hypothetical protein